MSEPIVIDNINKYNITFTGNKLVLTLKQQTININNDTQITKLDISSRNLTALPNDLPQSLKTLYCYGNKLTSLPDKLPQSLQELYCGYNQITALPNNLPQNLQELLCHNNQLTTLPDNLPQCLIEFDCSNNQLTILPDKLPQSLKYIGCGGNKLTSLPDKLPQNLKTLYCSNNQLTILPNLPISLTSIDLKSNPLEANYPLIFTFNIASEIVAYVNTRNAEMLADAQNKLAETQKLIAMLSK